MRSGGAEAAWRGYRLQALYVLWRIVISADPEHLVFQPEGREDLAVFDSAGRLTEASQVKARSDPLTVSDFGPEKPASFFRRAVETCKAHPGAVVKLVSFGPIGQEMTLAWQPDGPERRSIQRKLSDHGFTVEDVRVILDRVELVPLEEDRVQEDLFKFLTQTLAGVEPAHAFESLQFWLWSASENREMITLDTLIRKINNIGRFLAERASHHRQWFTSIVPIEDTDIHEAKRQTLVEEFYQGIGARYEHILADTDVIRDRKLAEVREAFRTARTVIIHAAYGQGKSTLAYRYLHDYFPQQWRFQVRAIQDRQHALVIARAIAGHARAVGVPVAVYVDVSARDRDWPELVAELGREEGLRVLVTIREEDWRRAAVSAVQFHYADVELTFDETEARELYDGLASRLQPDTFLSFDDAWRRFGAGGPLLEFVYLVTQNQSLHERLREQLRRLEDDVRTGGLDAGELELLRLVSVAAAYEASLDLSALTSSLSLPAPRRTLELFEREYLLRRTEDGGFVGGLHPIRSGILAGYLTDETFHPWATEAKTCLPMVAEEDLEVFFLHAFSRRRGDASGVLGILAELQPRTWTGLAGVLRSLLWLGVREYVAANEELIAEVFAKFGAGWSFVLDPDVAGVSPGFDTSWWEGIRSVPEHAKAEIADFQARQITKDQVFSHALQWLAGRERAPDAPSTLLDWAGLAETVFWAGYLSTDSPIPSWVTEADLASELTNLPLRLLGDVLLALSHAWGSRLSEWFGDNRAVVLERFQRETQSVLVEDDGRTLRVHFILDVVGPGEDATPPEGSYEGKHGDLHREALERLELARKLFPDREEYSCQGYGHKLGLVQLPSDDTQKVGIPADSFPPSWSVGLNSRFRYLGMYDLRPEGWGKYAQEVVRMRQQVLASLENLQEALAVHFRKARAVDLLRDHINPERWTHCRMITSNPPLLPKCAVDEWGFVGEGKRESGADKTQQYLQNLGEAIFDLYQYRSYLAALRELTFALTAFYDQSVHVLVTNSCTAKARLSESEAEALRGRLAAQGVKTGLAHWSTYNLAEALKVLPRFQREFSERYSQFFDSEYLERMERRELDTYRRAWSLWYQYAFHPGRVWSGADAQAQAKVSNTLSTVRSAIKRRLRKLSERGIQAYILSEKVQMEGKPALWIAFDVANPLLLYQAHQSVVRALKKAIGKVEGHELKRYALELHWPLIAFVPLLGGNCLAQRAWRISTQVFVSGDAFGKDDWWNYVQGDVPSESWQQLRLSTYQDERLALTTNLQGAVGSLALHVAHLHDLTRLPDVEGEGAQLLGQYLTEQSTRVSEALQRVLDLITEMGDQFCALVSDEQVPRPALAAAMEVLMQMWSSLLPSEDFKDKLEMALKSMEEWMGRLSSALVQAELLHLCWAADLLGLSIDSLEESSDAALSSQVQKP